MVLSVLGPLRQSGALRDIASLKIRKQLSSGWRLLKFAKSAQGRGCVKTPLSGRKRHIAGCRLSRLELRLSCAENRGQRRYKKGSASINEQQAPFFGVGLHSLQ